jgi:acetyl esterase/lipase
MQATFRRRALLSAGMAFLASMTGRAASGLTSPAGSALPTTGMPHSPVQRLDLWPSGAPGMPAAPPVEVLTERSTDSSVADRAVRGITHPRLSVFRPDRPNGAGVLLCPGGGYHHVVVDKEGYEMADWLAARGFLAFVLFYRLPGEGWAAGPDVALADAQRAMRVIRHGASGFGLAPDRLAAMGFSAGGHLCADLATRFELQTYEAVDAADALSARPFCAAPIYPVVSMRSGIAHPGSRRLLVGPDAGELLEAAHSPDRNVPVNAPPHFIVHAEDDASVPVENALLLRAALKAKGVPVETHLFRSGGHGFGLRGAAGKPVEVWPDLWRAWALSVGLA